MEWLIVLVIGAAVIWAILAVGSVTGIPLVILAVIAMWLLSGNYPWRNR